MNSENNSRIINGRDYHEGYQDGKNQTLEDVEKWLRGETDLFYTMEFEQRWNKFKDLKNNNHRDGRPNGKDGTKVSSISASATDEDLNEGKAHLHHDTQGKDIVRPNGKVSQPAVCDLIKERIIECYKDLSFFRNQTPKKFDYIEGARSRLDELLLLWHLLKDISFIEACKEFNIPYKEVNFKERGEA